MRKLGLVGLFFVVIVVFILLNGRINPERGIDGSVSDYLPNATFISMNKESTTTIFNYQYNDLPFSVIKETILITDSDGSFESTDIETDYLYNLLQYKSSLISKLATNYGISLYNNEKDFLSNIANNSPMIYCDLRTDTCYLYCFVSNMDDVNILFDFFGSVLVGLDGYLPTKTNAVCKSDIYLLLMDKRDIKESDIVQSKEFYMELVELTDGVDNELYRTAVSNHYFSYMEKAVFQSGLLDEFLK